jgi:hypothetical protein
VPEHGQLSYFVAVTSAPEVYAAFAHSVNAGGFLAVLLDAPGEFDNRVVENVRMTWH